MKKLYRFYVDCGRMGDIDSVFVAPEEVVLASFGKTIYLHDVLGKHSEIEVVLSEEDIIELSSDEYAIDIICKILGTSICGINPLDYIYDED